ncbi:hypothetical protein [Pedobacter puniceum]|jgi:hypothetical protein|uniref:Uncharacterized protein n=1 Tax=Pedobacter puniceum TaxID=2666136 RepID=A0A7K0FL16_9SPHI|nr:hypothetical protein [Pedobacter puniceum]MRX46321.1 hypothetical protein [Pedobacter puniceum]
MAISQNNVITHGLTGKIGDLLVFKRQFGKTVVTKIPAKTTIAPTSNQTEVKDRFTLASKFAKQVLQDPVLSLQYTTMAKKGQRVYNAAFADYFVAPSLSDPRGVYDGGVGTQLVIKAIDNYEVKEVQLAIYDSTGDLVEEGNATLLISGVDWQFTCTTAFANPTGCKLLWSATDWAGNTTELEITV